MNNRERVLDFLRSIWPAHASNSAIVSRTGISPHQQVFLITRELMQRGQIVGMKIGKEWAFRVVSGDTADTAPFQGEFVQHIAAEVAGSRITPPHVVFELLARRVMSEHYGTHLEPRRVSSLPKIFDLVSADHSIAGDAKFFTLVGGERTPPAKFSIIAEHVWLLENCGAEQTFLVFGNERRVPEQWLARYGSLVERVQFWFIDGSEHLSALNPMNGDSAT